MSNPISIEFDEALVESGGTVRGRIRLHPSEVPLEAATGLELRAQCRLSGTAIFEEKHDYGLRVEGGPFSAGHSTPFEIQLPDTPTTWRGEVVHVIWVIHVQLILHRYPDQIFEAPFELIPRRHRALPATELRPAS